MPAQKIILLVLLVMGQNAGSAPPSVAPGEMVGPVVIEVLFDHSLGMRLHGAQPRHVGKVEAEQLSMKIEQILAGGAAGHAWKRGCRGMSEATLDALHARGQANHAGELYNLNNIFRITLGPAADATAIARQLSALPGVLSAGVIPPPAPPPLPPDYTANQVYLDPATHPACGNNARYAWRWPGGNGAGVTICDIEYGWNFSHADLTQLPGSLLGPASLYWVDHGTAVAGILVADSNTFGTVGIAHGAAFKTHCTWYNSEWNVAEAIAEATAALDPGDVILLEQQYDYSTSEKGWYVPIEWWVMSRTQTFNSVYAAIQTAIACGIHVVEAGGNGNVDMDTLTWHGDSGAIIVGAGGAYAGGEIINGPLERLYFSSYGARVDVQGWGEDVYTTGFGDQYSAEGSNSWYTSTFSGTSSGSATIAGVVACLEGFWEQYYHTHCPPWLARRILKMTGTPQVTPPADNIGPRPDLRAAFFADTDQDGMLDGWEWAHGLSPTNAADADQDRDEDGTRNLDEFRADTDPGDPTSFLRITDLQYTSPDLRIEFPASTARVYAVQASTNLSGTNWADVISGQTTTGMTMTISLTSAVPSQIFRVDTRAPVVP